VDVDELFKILLERDLVSTSQYISRMRIFFHIGKEKKQKKEV
jgi:hypothetical protein